MLLRRWQAGVLAALAIFALACEGESGAGPGATPTATPTEARGFPSSMVSLGDSITAGYGSCAVYVACSRNSWSTGGSEDVNSHYARILARNPAMKGNARTFSVPGAEAADLPAQAASAVSAEPEYVTILVGANDACADDTGGMTPVDDFRDAVDEALDELKEGAPKARILVVSIPDLYRLWELGHDDPVAVEAWNRGICPSLLADPTDTGSAASARRARVAARVDDYNDELRRACKAYGKKCRWDGGAAHGVRFSLDLVNKFDYFHPNIAGQAKLSAVTYPGKFSW